MSDEYREQVRRERAELLAQDICYRCGCKHYREWCAEQDEQGNWHWAWTPGCERRSAVQRIGGEPGLDESEEFKEQCYREAAEIAERIRPGRDGGPPT